MKIKKLIGQGRDAIDLVVDSDSFIENKIDDLTIVEHGYGPAAVVGTSQLEGNPCTIISNDSRVRNKRFRMVYAGLIGLEEAYKMALGVYLTIEADKERAVDEKRPIILLVDTPGNAPGKIEEIFAMTTATGSYQMALAEARKVGHPVVAMVIGRAISGGFLCHGLQADRIVSLSKEYGTMIHVMPLTSIARITSLAIERLQELAESNPVFASGAEFFYKLGGVDEIIDRVDTMKGALIRSIEEIRSLKKAGRVKELGPNGRARLGETRGGRTMRARVAKQMRKDFDEVAAKYILA